MKIQQFFFLVVVGASTNGILSCSKRMVPVRHLDQLNRVQCSRWERESTLPEPQTCNRKFVICFCRHSVSAALQLYTDDFRSLG